MSLERAPIEEQLAFSNQVQEATLAELLKARAEIETLKSQNKELISALKRIKGLCGAVLPKHAMSRLQSIRGVLSGIKELADF